MSMRSAEDLYEHDFFAWTQVQARELRRFARKRPNVPLDLRHLADEVADLGKEQRNALRSWAVRIIEHLLSTRRPTHPDAVGSTRSSAFATRSKRA